MHSRYVVRHILSVCFLLWRKVHCLMIVVSQCDRGPVLVSLDPLRLSLARGSIRLLLASFLPLFKRKHTAMRSGYAFLGLLCITGVSDIYVTVRLSTHATRLHDCTPHLRSPISRRGIPCRASFRFSNPHILHWARTYLV